MSKQRIVSLVPSLTETLCFLGMEDNLVGTTSFCSEPRSIFKKKLSVGGTKNPDISAIVNLNPSHIIMNVEENRKEDFESLSASPALKNATILKTSVHTVQDSIALVKQLAEIFGGSESALAWEEECLQTLRACAARKKDQEKKLNFLYFIWYKPWMIASQGCYISALLEHCGFHNLSKKTEDQFEPFRQYPILTKDKFNGLLQQASLAVEPNIYTAFFSSEPFPFKKRHLETFEVDFLTQQATPMTKRIIDGQNLSWFGWRTLEGLKTVLELESLARGFPSNLSSGKCTIPV